jgi:hypothetical protein
MQSQKGLGWPEDGGFGHQWAQRTRERGTGAGVHPTAAMEAAAPAKKARSAPQAVMGRSVWALSTPSARHDFDALRGHG